MQLSAQKLLSMGLSGIVVASVAGVPALAQSTPSSSEATTQSTSQSTTTETPGQPSGKAGHRMMNPERQERMRQEREALYKKYNVSTETQGKVRDVETRTKEKAQQLREQIRQKQRDFRDYVGGENPNREEARRRSREIENLKAQLNDTWVDSMFEVRQLLPAGMRTELRDRHKQEWDRYKSEKREMYQESLQDGSAYGNRKVTIGDKGFKSGMPGWGGAGFEWGGWDGE